MTDDQMQRTDIPQDKNRTMREAFTMTDYKNTARNHLKVNLHLTETCNYRCRYCFAHFENGSDLPLEGGNLLDSSAPSYTVVGNLLEEPFEDVFRRYQLNVEEYEKRYDHIA